MVTMTTIQKCRKCGTAMTVEGIGRRRPTVCDACRQRPPRVFKERGPVTCADCQTAFTPPAVSGRPPERCSDCKLARKKATDSAKSKRWREANSEYQTEYMRAWHQAHKDDPEYRQRRSEAGLKKRHGLTPAELRAMVEAQGGKCAICDGPPNGPGKRLHVDHNHATGSRRSLLCAKCNTMIGLANDIPERLEAAAAYLRRWQ